MARLRPPSERRVSGAGDAALGRERRARGLCPRIPLRERRADASNVLDGAVDLTFSADGPNGASGAPEPLSITKIYFEDGVGIVDNDTTRSSPSRRA